MGRGRIARVATIAIFALSARGLAAPGDGSGSGSDQGQGDIEIEPEGGTGSGSGSAVAPTQATVPAPPPGGDAMPAKDPKVAKKWLLAAQQLVQKGDTFARQNKPVDAKAQYDNAVTAFGKAIEAGDDISVYFQLAVVEDKLGADASAYKHLKLVVDPSANQKPEVVKKAQAKLDEVTTKIGTLTLAVTPEGTAITMGDQAIGEAPLTAPLVLDPGTYTLSFAAVGYQPKQVEIKVEPGSESERKIALEPVPIVVKPIEHDEPTGPVAGPSTPSMLPLYVGAGATAGLLVIGTITGLSAVADHSTFTDPTAPKSDRTNAQSSGRTLARVTDACFVGAIAAGAFTAYWYVYKWAPAMRATGTDHWLLVSPWVAPESGGVAAVGSF